MADAYYPVIEVRSSYVSEEDEPERLGSKSKFWFRRENGTRCLFKFPRHDFGEHWAEKVAAEIGALIGIRCAEVQLARYDGHLGSMCVGFAEPEWLRIHGNEIMAEVIPGYRGNRTVGSGDHNIRNILLAVGDWAARNGLDADSVLAELASYAILDGLVGNTDRHHENWMFFHDPTVGAYQLAPSYDHGSSLGRELHDDSRRPTRSRRDILETSRVLQYLMEGGSRRGIYVRPHRELAPPPLLLPKLICRWRPQVVKPWLERLHVLPEERFRRVLDMVPDEFISETAREFAYQVIATSRREVLRRSR